MDWKSFNSILAKSLNIDQKQLNELHSAFAESLKDCSAQLDSASIPGFGTFNTVKKAESVEIDSDGTRKLTPPSIEINFRSSILLRKKLTNEK